MTIDLRSDTLTIPTEEMRKAMYGAEVGDEGRTGSDGKGEDPTVNRLERLAAEITGKEDSVFVCSGTMGNLVALLTYCSRGEKVAAERNLHIFRTEKGGFTDKIGGLQPVFFETEALGRPRLSSVAVTLDEHRPRLLCLENTHNFAGGTCLGKGELEQLALETRNRDVPIHLDGARVFNASVALGVPVRQLVSSVASVMFCLSKGLGAPVGSLLCGQRDFIIETRHTRKLLGGVMRQAGVIAAAGIVALTEGARRLGEDHKNARLLAERIAGQKKSTVDLESVQTNIVMVDVSPSGRDAKTFKSDLDHRGLRVHAMSDRHIRLVTYRGVSEKDVIEAADIFNRYCESI
jgi:threonine aldolase